MDFLDEHTPWSKKRQAVNTKMHRRASSVQTSETGEKVEVGYKSEIMGVTTKNDAGKIRGKSGQLILFEESGQNNKLLEAWNIARPSVEQDGEAFGTLVCFGTGAAGNESFEDLKELFYNPEVYGCLPLDNV
jgi:hypothetical protein